MRRRVDLKEAAEILGTTTEAVRKRAKRGTLDSETGDDGFLYVWVDEPVEAEAERVDGDGRRVDGRVDENFRASLIEHMASEIEHLREQVALEREVNRENRRLLAAALERVPPALEALPEPRESPETASGGVEGVEKTPPEREHDSQPWWEPRKQPKTAFDRWESGAVPHEDRDDSRSWWKRLFGFE